MKNEDKNNYSHNIGQEQFISELNLLKLKYNFITDHLYSGLE